MAKVTFFGESLVIRKYKTKISERARFVNIFLTFRILLYFIFPSSYETPNRLVRFISKTPNLRVLNCVSTSRRYSTD
jgi:hypothetical protein